MLVTGRMAATASALHANPGPLQASYCMVTTLETLIDQMDADPVSIVPRRATVTITPIADGSSLDTLGPLVSQTQRSCPIALGCQSSSSGLGYIASNGVIVDDQEYRLQLHCPTDRYRNPVGIGASLFNNSLVIMHPSVPQYVIPECMRVRTSASLFTATEKYLH